MTFVSDDLNRADDPTGLGAGWLIRSGAMGLASGMAYPVGTAQWAYATPTTAMATNDAEVSVTLGPADGAIDHFLLFVGANTSGECVFAYFYQGNAYFWHQYGWSSYANIQGASYLPQAPGDTITLRRNGTVHTILKNGVDTGISINYAVIPIDSSHLLLGFGLYSESQPRYRTIDAFSAKDTAVSPALSGGGTLSATVEVVTPPSGFKPTDLSGCTVWLDATQLGLAADASLGSTWPDLSGNNHHGSVVGSPAPVVKNNSPYSKPVVRFTVNEGRVRGTGMASVDSVDITVIYVARTVGPYVGRIFTESYPPNNFLVGTHTSGDAAMYDNGWINSGIGWSSLPTPWRMFGAVAALTPRHSTFYIDGVQSGTGVGGYHGPNWNLSGYDATGIQETCDCEVAELVTYDRALTDAERIQVQDYLHDKWFEEGGGPTPTPVAAAFTGGGSLSAAATAGYSRSIYLGGGGTLSATAEVVSASMPVSAGLSGSGVLSAAAIRRHPMSAASSGSGSLSATVRAVVPQAASLAGTGTLSATINPIRTVAVGLAGTGTLLATVIPAGTAPSSPGTWTPYPTLPAPRYGGGWTASPVAVLDPPQRGWLGSPLTTIPGRATGTGQLTVTVTARRTGYVLLAGDGQLAVSVFKREFRLALLAGDGQPSALYSQRQQSAPQFFGLGILYGVPISELAFPAFAGGGEFICYIDGLSATVYPGYSIGVNFSGDGTLLGDYSSIFRMFMDFAGQGLLSATFVPKLVSSLAGSGALSASAFQVYLRTAALLASGSLSATDFAQYLRSIGFTAPGALTALFLQLLSPPAGGDGTISAQVKQVYSASPAFSGGGTLTAFAGNQMNPAFSGNGTLSGTMLLQYPRLTGLSGYGALLVSLWELYQRSAAHGGTGTLTVIPSQVYTLATTLLSGGGTLSGSAVAWYYPAAALSGGGSLASGVFASYPSTSALAGSGTLSATAVAAPRGFINASLGGDGTLSATRTFSVNFTPITEENTARTNQTVPAGTTGCWVTLIGQGGAGGSGARGPGAQNRTGGTGGGGGGFVPRTWIPVASLGATYSVAVNTGSPAGGVAKTTTGTGNSGTAGAATTFVSGAINISAGGGANGLGGLQNSTATQLGGVGGVVTGATGDDGTKGTSCDNDVSFATTDNGASNSGGAGGGGGYSKGAIGIDQAATRGGNTNGKTGGAAGTVGSPTPGPGAALDPGVAGSGGGGSYIAITGGAGRGYGAGGGGGGSSNDSGDSGAGGTGGPGYSLIEWV